MGQITQKDIAEALKISRETVTKALLDHPGVSSGTKKTVHRKAKEMGYTPNFFARNLSSSESKTIGLIIPKISHSFFSSITEKIYIESKKRGYTVISMISFEDRLNEEKNIYTLLSMRVDGLIACISKDTTDDKMYRHLRKTGIPVVFFDRVLFSPGYPCVITNDREISCKVVGHALSYGYSRPAHLAGYMWINIGNERKSGYMDALHKYGIEVNPEFIIEGGFTKEDGYHNALKLLKMPEPPDLIFTINDTVAQGVYEAAAKMKISIPDKLGVIGFGNLESGALLIPPLTSVKIPTDLMAQKVVDLILNRIVLKKETGSNLTVIPAEMIIRQSCNKTILKLPRVN